MVGFRCVLVLVVGVACVVSDTTKCTKGPCGPGNQECGPLFGRNTPQFHVRGTSCGENDPNGPVYDPNHKMYHLFYQDHLAMPQNGLGRGPDWGHAASRDLVHWVHLPEAIWNDQWYDIVAIYTGSATVVDGKVTIVYPGLCDKSHPSCNTGTALSIALPSDPSDPFLTNWTKPHYNPVVNNTQRDPSTAWQTKAGEWRLTTFTGHVYRSMDFIKWNLATSGTNFPGGECPSFFPLPKLIPGIDYTGTLPTHVHKCSHSGDWMQVGTYTEGPVGSAGTWQQTPGVTFDQKKIDMGNFYASKDFWDPVKERRINWGWAQVPPSSTQTLPREAFYHPVMQRILWAPIEEQAQLRSGTLATKKDVHLTSGTPVSMGLPDTKGNQSEVLATFTIPPHKARFGVAVWVGTGSALDSQEIFVEYDPASPHTVNVGSSTGGPLGPYMPGTDLPGGDYNITNVNYKDPHECETACDHDAKCKAWTYVIRPPLYASCCLKRIVPNPNPNGKCTSGVKSSVHSGAQTDTLQLMPGDKTIDVRVYVDNTFVEVFWSGQTSSPAGVAMTSTIRAKANPQQGVSLFSDADVTVTTATVWGVKTIWVSKEEVMHDIQREKTHV